MRGVSALLCIRNLSVRPVAIFPLICWHFARSPVSHGCCGFFSFDFLRKLFFWSSNLYVIYHQNPKGPLFCWRPTQDYLMDQLLTLYYSTCVKYNTYNTWNMNKTAHSALKLEKSAISKVQIHIIYIFKYGKNQFLH